VKEFYEEYKRNPAKANNIFLQALEPKMKELITHINNKDYDDTVIYIETLLKAKMLKQQGLDPKNLEHDYLISKQITAAVNAAEQTHKSELDEFTQKAKSYFADLRKNKLRDWLIDPNSRINGTKVFLRMLLILLCLPLYLTGIICHYLPYWATEKIVRPKVRNREFYSSFAIGVGLILFWLNLGIWFTVIYYLSPDILMPLAAAVVLVLCGWFTLHFHFFIIKTAGMLRAVKNPGIVAAFSERRRELMALVNKFLSFQP
jgi:hypothetical protein